MGWQEGSVEQATTALMKALSKGAVQAGAERKPRRFIVALAGAPGVGKSTLAQSLQARCGDASVVVPMDGFHLAQRELQRLGRAHRKGAVDTFDAHGFAALVERVRGDEPTVVYAPSFERAMEEPLAGAIAIAPHHRVVIVEGNYLLLDASPWREAQRAYDVTWYLQIDEGLRLERLIRRHERFGRTRADAEAWVRDSDEVNARLIATTRARAQWVVHV